MKTLYLDCGMGAAGDMLTAALAELLPDSDLFFNKLNKILSVLDVEVKKEKAVKCGITGTHAVVLVGGTEEGKEHHHEGHHHEGHGHGHEDHEHYHEGHGHSHEDHEDHHEEHTHSHGHVHRGMHEIEHLISHLDLPEKVREDVLRVYALIAEAESHAHGVPVSEIHFHEVGTMDAIADITAVCLLMKELAPDQVVISPVHVGSGQVKCAHGILPVPAPATAYILKEVPIYGGSISGELCTPTGAALLKYFGSRFGDMPVRKVQAVGYGMGKKDFPRANCVRAMLGESGGETERMLELSCNVDDMTAEEMGFAMEQLLESGAREVYTIAAGMKKSRPGTVIHVICTEQDREKMLGLLFRHTTTLGVRETVMQRYVLERKIETLHTSLGEIRRKSSSGYGVSRVKYEYEDLARIARERGISLEEARRLAEEE